ncbi:class I SAM-dependent methyltransferase [Mesorhizobium sangaii]|uniref:SAM-dependent methyltransferase n=1 Tax=Mesorhizobium sangaii TaxID=505389 RepID=A0A841NXF8_9HYPH|nr:class I SAM-dependent methyltransferase [Mesorhizobium sangaii]MBB6407656.1 SAM-dependent methyltransferase [Mesorhizobium sangaii]
MHSTTDNVAGHRAKYEHLTSHMPLAEAKKLFVGGGDPDLIGRRELDIVESVRPVAGADIIDVGCGIGRLTRHLVNEPISSYLGLDIIEEILDEARKIATANARFSFAVPKQCIIPAADDTADLVVGFSLITHLLNEEIMEYLWETRRVLREGGIAIFSFLDLTNEEHRASFAGHARQHRHGHGDLLTFTTRETVSILGGLAGFRSVRFLDEASFGQSVAVLS